MHLPSTEFFSRNKVGSDIESRWWPAGKAYRERHIRPDHYEIDKVIKDRRITTNLGVIGGTVNRQDPTRGVICVVIDIDDGDGPSAFVDRKDKIMVP